MTTHFLTFRNDESWAFFRWLTERNDADLARLLGQATDAAGLDEWTELAAPGFDALQQALAGLLLEYVQQAVPAVTLDLSECASLPQLMEAIAATRIDFDTVAAALLVHAGRWHPAEATPTLEI